MSYIVLTNNKWKNGEIIDNGAECDEPAPPYCPPRNKSQNKIYYEYSHAYCFGYNEAYDNLVPVLGFSIEDQCSDGSKNSQTINYTIKNCPTINI